MYTLDFNKLEVLVFPHKNGAPNVVAAAQMKFASEARPSHYTVLFGNTEKTCRLLSGHIMDIEGRVQEQQTKRYQLSLTNNA